MGAGSVGSGAFFCFELKLKSMNKNADGNICLRQLLGVRPHLGRSRVRGEVAVGYGGEVAHLRSAFFVGGGDRGLRTRYRGPCPRLPCPASYGGSVGGVPHVVARRVVTEDSINIDFIGVED